jgi:hypothetical protein
VIAGQDQTVACLRDQRPGHAGGGILQAWPWDNSRNRKHPFVTSATTIGFVIDYSTPMADYFHVPRSLNTLENHQRTPAR